MKPIRTGVLWILSTSAVLLSTGAIADIPSAANDCVSDLVESIPSRDFTVLEGGRWCAMRPPVWSGGVIPRGWRGRALVALAAPSP
jgi:hypothetical protein